MICFGYVMHKYWCLHFFRFIVIFQIFWAFYVAFCAYRPRTICDAATNSSQCLPNRQPRLRLWTMAEILIVRSNLLPKSMIGILHLDLHFQRSLFFKIWEVLELSNQYIKCLHNAWFLGCLKSFYTQVSMICWPFHSEISFHHLVVHT